MDSSRGLSYPTWRDPVRVIISVRVRTRAWCSSATVGAMNPPIDAPTGCTWFSPRPSRSPPTSAAIPLIEYGGGLRRTTMSASRGGRSRRWVDSLTSLLSNRTTNRPRRVRPPHSLSGQACGPAGVLSRQAARNSGDWPAAADAGRQGHPFKAVPFAAHAQCTPDRQQRSHLADRQHQYHHGLARSSAGRWPPGHQEVATWPDPSPPAGLRRSARRRSRPHRQRRRSYLIGLRGASWTTRRCWS